MIKIKLNEPVLAKMDNLGSSILGQFEQKTEQNMKKCYGKQKSGFLDVIKRNMSKTIKINNQIKNDASKGDQTVLDI